MPDYKSFISSGVSFARCLRRIIKITQTEMIKNISLKVLAQISNGIDFKLNLKC